MRRPLRIKFLQNILVHFAGRAWSGAYLDTMVSVEPADGAVTGAQEHMVALIALCRADLDDVPLPSRHGLQSVFHD